DTTWLDPEPNPSRPVGGPFGPCPSHSPGGRSRPAAPERMANAGCRTPVGRRWPPKRCRILADGDLNAIPVGRTLGMRRERPPFLDHERIAGPGRCSVEPYSGALRAH